MQGARTPISATRFYHMHPYARLNLVDPHRTSDLVQYLFNQPPAQNKDWSFPIDLVHDNNNSITLKSSLSIHLGLQRSTPEICKATLSSNQPNQRSNQLTSCYLSFCLPPKHHLLFICMIDFRKSANRVNYCIPLSKEVMDLQKGRLYNIIYSNYQMHPNAI